jgi:hypothetical protein
MNIEVHDMHDKSQLTKIDLIFEQGIAVTRHFDQELVLEIFHDLWIL